MRTMCTRILPLILLPIWSTELAAQEDVPLKARSGVHASVPDARINSQAPPTRLLVPLQTEGKSATLAGALSFVLPGLGSFYAGNIGHGIRHLVAVPVVIGATALGLHLANEDDGEAEAAEYAVLLSGAVLLVANGIWGVVTAVNDAHDHNRSVRLGPFNVEPSVQAIGNARLALAASLWF